MDTPKIHSVEKADEIRDLQAIMPIDGIDKACQAHDICYVKRGFNDRSCDAELVQTVKALEKKYEEKTCRRLVQSIVFFFETKNENFVRELTKSGSVKSKIIDASTTSTKNFVDMMSFSSKLALNYGFSRPIKYVIDSDNNKERMKDFLQALPPRNKACIEKK